MAVIGRFTGKYGWASNFLIHQVRFRDHLYPSSEHAYHAAKCAREEERKQFENRHLSCAAAKSIGRHVELVSDWEETKDDIMREIFADKFSDPVLQVALAETSPDYLLEGNVWHDNYWGCCMCGDRCQGIGKNMLGVILMEIRG